jgi:hypothetical protein
MQLIILFDRSEDFIGWFLHKTTTCSIMTLSREPWFLHHSNCAAPLEGEY